MSDRLDEILGKLEGVKRSGQSATACCPAHDDTRPSLSLKITTLGKIVLNCHAGCSPDAVVAKLGLTLADLFAPEPSRNGALGKPVAEYTYTDEGGAPLFQVLRFEPKDFRVRRADAIGGWSWGFGDVRRVLYRLPELGAAIAAEQDVYLVEGEKDADRLRRAGVVATCNPVGAGKWRQEYTVALTGARVIIVADRDAAGRKHAADVARQLEGVATSVRIVEPATGKDASDHLSAGRTVSEFIPALVSELSQVPKEPAGAEETPLPAAVCALDAPAAGPIGWTVAGLILANEITLFVADGGVGKTTAALAIAGAVAGGYLAFDYLDFDTTRASVLFVSEEDPAGVLLNRLEALIAGHGWERHSVLSQIHLFALAGLRLADLRWQAHLVAEAQRVGAGLIILDPLVEMTAGDESSNTDQRPVIQFCRHLIRETGAAVILVHHAGKAVEGKRKLDRVRGASAWNAAARAIYFCEVQEDGLIVECLKLSRAKRPPPFVLERSVTEDGEQEGTWAAATLRFKTAQAAGQDRAERWVIEQLESAGDRLNTTELKALAKGSGISAADVSFAIRHLTLTHRIDFQKGDRGAKCWGLRQVAGQGRQRAQNMVADLAERLPGKVAMPAVTLPTPLEGARSGNHVEVAGQPEIPRCSLHPRVPLRQRTDGMWRCPECVPDSRWRVA
jgi:putative DNA primase/helicase